MEHDLEFLIEDFYNKISEDSDNYECEDHRDSPNLQELAYKHYAC